MEALGYIQDAESEPAAIRLECERRGWSLIDVVVESKPRSTGLERRGLRSCLERLAAGEAQVLIVPGLDSVSRSLTELAAVLGWLAGAGGTLVCLDPRLNTARRGGRLVAEVVGRLAEWQREDVAARTRTGLARARRHGQPVGRPAVADRPELHDRIADMRGDGMSLQAIADVLNAERVPTLRGGAKWRPSSVQAATGYRRGGRPQRGPKLPPPPPPPPPGRGPGPHGPSPPAPGGRASKARKARKPRR